MFNFTLFPEFKPMVGQCERDHLFLKELRSARTVSGAGYVSFSLYDYDLHRPGVAHFLTYPMDWITHYIRKGYFSHDPFMSMDFRRHVCLDWRDHAVEGKIVETFNDLRRHTKCNQAVSVVTHLTNNSCSVTSFNHQCAAESWPRLKRDLEDIHKFYAERLSTCHEEIFQREQLAPAALTERESQCLYWVANGKTDDEIAILLGIGKWTVVSHIKHAKEKLAVRNRASAVAVAITKGLINLDEAS